MTLLKSIAKSVVRLEVLIVFVITLATFAEPRLLAAAVVIILLISLIRQINTEELPKRTEADLAIVLLLVMAAVTIWISPQREITIPQVLRLLLGICFYYAVVNWTNTVSKLHWVTAGFILVGVGFAFIAPLSVEWTTFKLPFIPVSIYDRFVRLVSDTVHRNVMAGYLLMLFPLGLGILLFGIKEINRVFLVSLSVSLVFIAGVLVLTQSRGAVIGFVVVLIAMVVLRFRRGWIMIPVSLAAGLLAVNHYGIDQVLDFFSSGISLEGIDGRIDIWSRAIYMIQDFPITGIGMGLFGSVADTFYPLFRSPPSTVSHAHNLFLQVAVDLGVPGLIAWVSILSVVLRRSWQSYRQGLSVHSGSAAGIGAGLLCSQFGIIAHGVVDAVTWGVVSPAPLVWGIWALVVAAGNVYLRQSR